jgi:hypothetical protein
MKTSKFLNAAMLLVFACILIFNFTTISAKTKSPTRHVKIHPRKKLLQIYFEVQEPSSSNIYVLIGRGTALSGSIDTYEIGCVNGVIDAAGTSTGTYSYNSSTGVMSLDGTVTPHGQSPFTVLGPPIEYSGDPISINCGN